MCARMQRSRARTLLMADKNTYLPCILVKISDAVWKFNDAFFSKGTQRLTVDYTIFLRKPGSTRANTEVDD